MKITSTFQAASTIFMPSLLTLFPITTILEYAAKTMKSTSKIARIELIPATRRRIERV